MKTISLFQKSPEENSLSNPLKSDQAMGLTNEGMKRQTTSDCDGMDLPTLPDSVFISLPAFLQKVVARCGSPEDRDMMLLGSLVAFSSCLPKVHGIYGGKKVYSNLFLFITAQASAGKGNLVHCRQLVNPVHETLRLQTQVSRQEYKTGMRQYDLLKWKEGAIEKPDRPPELMLFIPANNSASGVFQLLYENDGCGLIFETEGDTLSHAFQSDSGQYSDGLRKGFHHEMISFHRRTDREHVEIKCPRISVLLSGTYSQLARLILNAENGLFSRFLFYHLNLQPAWKDMFAPSIEGMEEYFDSLGQEFFSFYKALKEHPAIGFSLTPGQHEQFNAFFIQIQEKYLALQGTDFMATIRRFGLIAFRMAMILTSLRLMETGNFSQKQVCSDSDFQTVLSMIRVLVRHSSHVFSELTGEAKLSRPKDKKEQFLDMLPGKFTFQDFIAFAKGLSINERTAKRHIAVFCEKGFIYRENQGNYINLTFEKRETE
jgi:hypothetical protein